MKPWQLTSCGALLFAVSMAGAAHAGDASATSGGSAEQEVTTALKALERGAFDEAIDRFELLADRGFVHPDASFDRGVAYIRRAVSTAARPGDLGRAAAALAETLELRPSDTQAEAALERVQAEIARRRARTGVEPVTVRPTLGRALASLVPEDIWAIAALFASLVTTAGLAVRFLTRRESPRLGGAIAAVLGGIVLLTAASLTAAARHFRLTSDSAVIVVPEARLLDYRGTPIIQKDGVPEHVAIPEGAAVEVGERRGELARVEWGPIEGWIATSQVRVLAKP